MNDQQRSTEKKKRGRPPGRQSYRIREPGRPTRWQHEASHTGAEVMDSAEDDSGSSTSSKAQEALQSRFNKSMLDFCIMVREVFRVNDGRGMKFPKGFSAKLEEKVDQLRRILVE